MHFNRLTFCGVCSKTLSSRYNGFCPSCAPLARAAGTAPRAGRNSAPADPDAVIGDNARGEQARLQPALPTMEAVHTKRVPVLKYIPKQLRGQWSRCLSQTLASTAHHNSVGQGVEQQMLAKCVLCAPLRAGKQHQSQRVAFTRQRLQRWLDGERASLWQDIPSYRLQSKPKLTTAAHEKALRHKRCEELCREGADSQACRSLYAESPSDPSTVFEEMVAKHPRATSQPDLSRLGAPSLGLVPGVDAEAVLGAVKSFNKHSGAGPSGLRPFHIRQSLVPAHSDQVVEHLLKMVNLMVRGEAPKDIAPWLCGASLMALPKKDGSSRPIAVSEVLRRLAAKVMCAAYQEQARDYLWPLQVGVAQPLGTEVGLQVSRQWCGRHRNVPNAVFLKLDFANAFNTVDREHILEQVRRVMPGLAPWVDYCYANPSKLLLGSRTVSSESGVQQGDPLGPLLFALALQPVLQELAGSRRPGGLDLVFSYLDDLCLAGDAAAVSAALSILKVRCAAIGLQLSTGLVNEAGEVLSKDKCELILAAGTNSTVNTSEFPADFKVVRDGNFELLGGPIGNPRFCNEHTEQRVAKASRLLTALGEVPDPQVALQLLRRCAGFSKMVYSLRVVPPSFQREALQSFDDQVRACFEEFTCLHPDDRQWTQATLSTDSGGLGLRCLSKHADAAHLASRSRCFELCRQLDPAHTFETTDALDHNATPESVALRSYNSSVNDDDQVPTASTGDLTQKQLSSAIDKRTHAQLMAQGCATQVQRAHLSLLSASGAGLFLQATPSKTAHLDMEPALFIATLRRWLRMPFAEQDVECPCCDGVLDCYGDHALVCCGCGDRTRRHNLLRNMVFHSAAAANLNPELEKPGLLPQRPSYGSLYENGSAVVEADSNSGSRRPADVYVPRWRAGPPAAWDFAVTSGLRLESVAESLTDPDSVLTKYEDFKCSHQDTKNQCLDQGLTFIPLVMEATGGGWGKVARGVWSELAKTSALASGELETNTSCAISLLQRLSMTLRRENARSCLKRFGSS